MKKWLKRLGIGLGVIVLLVLGAVGVAWAMSVSKEGATYDVDGATFEIPSDPESLVEGERLFVARGCGSHDCHAEDGGGASITAGPLGTMTGANLTVATREYEPADWDRAVRHGVRRDGTSLIFMPSVDFQDMSDRELGMIVAHVRSLPRVTRPLPETDIGLVARIIDLFGGFHLFPASAVDHDSVDDPDPEPGRTVEYGRYLGQLCIGCHGEGFSGGPIPGAPPEMGNPANLTPHENGLAGWTEEQFRAVLREGRKPDGSRIDDKIMPWPLMSRMTDDEIGALFMFLQSLPPTPHGNR